MIYPEFACDVYEVFLHLWGKEKGKDWFKCHIKYLPDKLKQNKF